MTAGTPEPMPWPTLRDRLAALLEAAAAFVPTEKLDLVEELINHGEEGVGLVILGDHLLDDPWVPDSLRREFGTLFAETPESEEFQGE